MKNSTSFKSVKVGDKVRFIGNEEEEIVAIVISIDDKKFYAEYSYTWEHPDGLKEATNIVAFSLKNGKKQSRYSFYSDCLEIL